MASAGRNEPVASLCQEQTSLNEAIDADTSLAFQENVDKLELECARRLAVD